MRVCVSAAAANAGGGVTYLANVLPELARIDPGDRFLVVAPQPTLDTLASTLDAACFDTECYPHPPVRQGRRMLFDQLRIPALARSFAAQAVFSTNGFGTFRSGCPEALLVRNALYFAPLLEEKLKALGRSRRQIQLRRFWSLLSIRCAQKIIFPTLAMRERVQTHASLEPKRTAVIRYGFDRERFFSDQMPSPEALEPMHAWRRDGRKIILYVAGYAVHKNFETAVEALAQLLSEGVDAGLVLTAVRKDWGEMREFQALLERVVELGIEKNVHWTGEVPWHELHALYSASDLFLFPSFLESFGHPMVEAMASGLPSVASDTPVNREIFGEAALFFEPFDPLACARLMKTCLENETRAAELRNTGLERSRSFSWAAHTRDVHALLASLTDPSS